ncbi:MAG: hypothetical protein WAV72_25910 [Bradyrhizobium sp.]
MAQKRLSHDTAKIVGFFGSVARRIGPRGGRVGFIVVVARTLIMLFILVVFQKNVCQYEIYKQHRRVPVEVTVRGWARDMGPTKIASHFLPTVEYRQDGTAYRDKPVMYQAGSGVTVAWYQPLRLTGNYRMEVNLTRYDVMRLFKATFGSELQQALVDRYGLTFSPDVVKSVLKTVKLTDLTLGDLVEMSAGSPSEQPVTAEKAVEVSNVKPFRRV